MKRPRVIIPEILQDVSNYTKALYAAGFDPVVVSIQSFHASNTFQQEYMDFLDVRSEFFDGLLLPGGGDINPEEFGEENHGSKPVDIRIDKLQFHMLESFIRNRKPILGICRGLQLINVWFGGSLIQDLESKELHQWSPVSGDQLHSCRTVKDCWLAKLYGDTFVHNSSHHQAIHVPGRGIVTDSWCPDDNVIEAIHHKSLPIYAVQWHPERLSLSYERNDAVNGLEVFRFFCKVCGGTPDTDDPYISHPFRSDGVVSEGLGL